MTQGKGNRDEKLIEELYEKLYWYTFEASEEEFDSKEVDAIVGLLDVIDPKEDDPKFPSEPKAAFERFKMRYGLEEEFSETAAGEAGEEEGKESGAAGTAGTGGGRDTVAATGAETYRGSNIKGTDESGNYEKKKRGSKGRKRLVRLATGVAACLVLMLSVNFGSYALKKKSFYDFVMSEVGRIKVTVVGNDEIIHDEEKEPKHYENWSEVENIIGTEILKPSYLPQGYELSGITIDNTDTKQIVIGKYSKMNDILRVEIDFYNKQYVDNTFLLDEGWSLLEKESNIQYYQKENQIEAFFIYEKGVYIIRGELELGEMKKITNSMFD